MTALELRVALEALNLSHSSLARTIGVSRGSVLNWVYGRYPVPETVSLLLRVMLDHGLTVKDLRS